MTRWIIDLRADPGSGVGRRRTPKSSDPVAVASLVCSLLGLVGFFAIHLGFAVLCFVAVLLGVIAARRLATSGGPGRVLATVGFIVGAVGIIATMLLVVGLAINAPAT